MFHVIRTTLPLLRSGHISRLLIAAIVACVVAPGPLQSSLGSQLAAADQPDAEISPDTLQSAEIEPAGEPLSLAVRQKQVAQRFQRLEELLLRLAEVEATENPERSALLRRAAKQSRDSFILDRLSAASEALSGSQYQQAIDAQQSANENLAALLKLLLTEDRSERIRNEKERISNWIKDLKREERKQRAARARTENGAELDAISEEQREIIEKAAELQQQMAADSEVGDPPGNSEEPSENRSDDESSQSESGEPQEAPMNDSNAEPSDSDSDDTSSAVEKAEHELEEAEERLADAKQAAEAAESDEEASEDERAEAAEELKKAQENRDAKAKALAEAEQQPSSPDSEPSDSPPSDSESQPSESEPSESQPSESQPSESQQSESQPQKPQTPEQQAEKKLQSAIERMKEAQQELEKAKREEATDRQREAEKNLREAIDQLEKILRQLREEEMQRELARLESRLRKMAQMQSDVLDRTRELAAVPLDSRDRQTDLQAGSLAGEEKKIVLEADRAMLLLREEGSSVAFPEVVQQIRGDMRTVAERLAQSEIDEITQGIQEDILAALEEMIAALQKAQRDLEEQRQQEQMPPQQAGQPGEQPLVESLAELKLIRTMQERIKGTTDRYAEMIDETDQPVDQDFLGLLQNLADRQSRLSTITRDIALERNR